MRLPAALTRICATALAAMALLSVAGCSTASLAFSAVGIATDTSISWEIAKHLHAKYTEGDPVYCFRMNSVEKALTPRCGSFSKGSIRAEDIRQNELQGCPVTIAARNPVLWPVLPELLNKGAQPESCGVPPLVALAASHPCPDFKAASPESLKAIAWLAEADARSIRHDVVRMLSCPNARQVGLDRVLDTWLDSGAFQRDVVGFGVLGALHPDYLQSPFARKLESQGHTAQASLGPFEGRQPAGFEAALRAGHQGALQWWFNRAPQLANRVPPTQGNQLAWSPLARVLQADFMTDPSRQKDTIAFLLDRGADPWKPMPGGAYTSVVQYARFLQSPHVALLNAPVVDTPATPRRLLAKTGESAPVGDLAANQGH
ncbi:hypothetical protein [Rhizobacter sp. Root1221]|uniref:hypothetical protein n=1 Tax=Rhizobacter sp. Root1221 TaxID=1736433 RepID=UPI0006FB1655|nr:hypothetical protein [Rhizobacter sp. Root1221]KQW03110.1 hypothetical protein ASC87_01905 [Rhizobacter sp. Root1221]